MSDFQSIGVAPLPEGGRVEFARLREERRHRLFDAMEGARVDVLLLGRPANVAFAGGARQLWTSGTRPFSPACVVVGAERQVHLLSTWDEGVPSEIPRANLIGLSWNPSIASSRLQGIGGLAAAARVATDGWNPGTGQLVASLCPGAEVVDAARVLRLARSAKSPDEMACLATAAAVAEAALSAMSEALEAGVTERDLLGVYASTVASLGLPCPPSEGVAFVSGDAAAPRRVASERRVDRGDLVALNPGAAFAGYEASVARTRTAGASPGAAARRAAQNARAALDAVIGVCRPGASGANLLEAWETHGGTALIEPLAWGLGLGVEPPVIGPAGIGASAVLRSGAVLAVQAWTVHPGVGAMLEQDVVAVGPEGPKLLTRSRPGLSGAGPRA